MSIFHSRSEENLVRPANSQRRTAQRRKSSGTDRRRIGRHLVFEPLEARTLLSADGLGIEQTLLAAQILDNGDPGYATVGRWTNNTRSGHDGDMAYKGKGNGAAVATWTFDVEPGRYQVSATWIANRRSATNAEFTLASETDPLAAVQVNQRLRPGDLTDEGSQWQNLGKPIVVSGNALVVQLSDRANGRVTADAVRIERLADVPILELWDGAAMIEAGEAVDFGITAPGFAVDKTLTVRNGGTLDLNVQSPAELPVGFALANDLSSAELAPGETTTFTLQMESAESEGLAGSFNLASNAAEQDPFALKLVGKVTTVQIVNNGDSGYATTGRWTSTSRIGHGGDMAYKAKGNGNAVASWTFDVAPGRYLVSATWATNSRAATNAQYTIVANGAARSPVAVNQRQRPSGLLDEGSDWQHLGKPVVVRGNSLVVQLSDRANGRVTADAIRIERLPDVPILEVWNGSAPIHTGQVLDFGVTLPDFAVSKTITLRNAGTENLSLQAPAELPDGFKLADDFQKAELEPGEETTFTVVMASQSVEELEGSIMLASNDFESDQFAVSLSGTVSMVQIIDDGDAGYSTTGNWKSNSGAGYANDHDSKSSARGANPASWTFDVQPGAYRVSATWPEIRQAASNSPFEIYDGAVYRNTVQVNQRVAPGDFQDGGVGWQDLGGPYLITGNTLEVRLVDQANGRLLADAVRIERLSPVAVDDVFNALENTPLWIPASGVLANDSTAMNQPQPGGEGEVLAMPSAGSPLIATLVSGPAHGSLTLNADGSFSYAPNPGYTGTDTFTYQASDGTSDSNEATVAITVEAANQAPVAYDQSVETNEDTAKAIKLTGSDPDGDPLSYTVVTSPVRGTLTGTAPDLTYTPSTDYVGEDTFTFQVDDNMLTSAIAIVSIMVNAVNNAPVAVNDSYSLNVNTTLTVPVAGVLANDTDANGDPLTAVLVTGPSNGTLTLNPNGSFTYTPTADFTGTDSFSYKSNDGTLDSNVATVNLMVNPVNTILITPQWLTAQGTGPYLLTQADTTYLLQTDVTVEGTAFVVGAANVTLDLNGHTVTYGNAAPITVPNGGFEEGSGTDVPHWDLSGAPSAAVASNLIYAWGDKVLKFTDITSAETIVSDLISIPTANREYTATVTPKGPSGAGVTLRVVDAETGAVIASAASTAVERGFAAVVSFTPDESVFAVKLAVEVKPAAGTTQTVYLDYASLTHGRDHGVVASGNSSSYWPLHLRTVITDSQKSKNTTIRNGTLTQGQGNGYHSHAIWARSTKQDFTVDGVAIHVTGIDTRAIWASIDSYWGEGTATIQNTRITAAIDKITDRMFEGDMVSINADHAIISNNQIKDHPRTGISVAGGSGHTISHNTIDSNANATNCYGIILQAVHDTKVHDNTIVTIRSGRGIMLDGLTGQPQDSVNVEIFNNYVDVRERPNLEYGYVGIEATALRLRSYRVGGHRGLSIHDNVFIARTDEGYTHGAIGLRVFYANSDEVVDWGNVIRDNVFKAIVNTTNTSYWARAVTLEGLAPLTHLQFIGNTLESNDISLGLGGNDGKDAHDALFVSTTFGKSSDGPVRPYMSVYAGLYNGSISGIHLIDNRYAGGASNEIVFAGTGTKQIQVGWLLHVQVRNTAGDPLGGASVEVFEKDGQKVFSGLSGENGLIEQISVVTRVLTKSGSDPLNTDERGPHRVKVSLTGHEDWEQVIDVTKSMVLEVQL